MLACHQPRHWPATSATYSQTKHGNIMSNSCPTIKLRMEFAACLEPTMLHQNTGNTTSKNTHMYIVPQAMRISTRLHLHSPPPAQDVHLPRSSYLLRSTDHVSKSPGHSSSFAALPTISMKPNKRIHNWHCVLVCTYFIFCISVWFFKLETLVICCCSSSPPRRRQPPGMHFLVSTSVICPTAIASVTDLILRPFPF